MSAIAALFNVPEGREELDAWASAHARHHVDINRYIYQRTGLSLPEFVLEPINPDDTAGWDEHHVIMHQNQDALLGIEGYDLSGVDFNDKDNLTAWIQLNAIEHREAEDLLRISVPVIPNNSIVSTFRSHAEASSGGTVGGYSFPGMDFGPESANRILVACLAWTTPALPPSPPPSTFSAASIGGVAATVLVSSRTSAIVAALVPAGTSGTVAFAAAGIFKGAAAVYSMANLAAVGASFVTSATNIFPNVAFDVAARGCVIAVAANYSQFPPSPAWTGLTEDCDNTISINPSLGRSTASINLTSAAMPLSTQCSFSVPFGTLGSSSGCWAYFAPGT